MECRSYRILISGYLDEELSPEEMVTLKSHVQTCHECQTYLKHAETMKTAFKHYTLFQPSPEIPEQFAQHISTQLEEIVRAETPSLAARMSAAYRSYALQLAERWAGSLRTRPFAWTTVVTCLFICLAGILFFTMSPYSPTQETVQIGELSPRASVSAKYPPQSEVTPSLQDHEQEVSLVNTPESFVRFEETDDAVSTDTDVVKFAEDRFVRVAQTDVSPVEDYVYSHILEGYPDHIVDSTVFVGYVQNTFIE